MTNYFFRALCVSFVLVIAACASAPDGKPMPDLTFEQISPSSINVAAVKVTNEATSPPSDPFVVAPENATAQYLARRFTAAGAQGVLNAVIEEARVRHLIKDSQNSAAKFLNVAKFDEYEIEVRIRFEHLETEFSNPLYKNTINAKRIVRVTEHASVAEREKRQLEALEILFKEIDGAATRIVLGDMRLGV
jgi:hypothetical protein